MLKVRSTEAGQAAPRLPASSFWAMRDSRPSPSPRMPAPAVAFQNITFDKGIGQPRVVMTLGDPDTDGRVETRTVQERHAHILEALGWTRQS